MRRKICFFTGSRAEFGIMHELMHRVDDDENCQLQMIATNMHLSPEFGLTYKEIEADGLAIDKKVEMLLSSDTSNGIVKSMGLGMIGFADALEDLQPDLAVILGDRYEMLAAAAACLIYKVPIAHLGGGDITEGAYDDAIRHSISKMSSLHFTSTEKNRHRLIQMGEQPERVFWVGGLGLEEILNTPTLTLGELEQSIDFNLGTKFLVITFHPVTMEDNTAEGQCRDLLKALEEVNSAYKLLFTLPNSDTDGRIIISLINEFVSKNKERRYSIQSLGKKRYFSALKYASAVVGNSSSGLVEAPSFHIPTLNIGNRQQGRSHGDSVIDVAANYKEIKKGINILLSDDFRKKTQKTLNPYEKVGTLDAIFKTISTCPLENLSKKRFYNI